ncbi:hypothetical protein AB1K84_13720 [Mesobacillus foraminis]
MFRNNGLKQVNKTLKIAALQTDRIGGQIAAVEEYYRRKISQHGAC